MEQDLLNLITQFGAAGLIAWMWLTERRHSAKREQQLTEAHEQLRQQRIALDQLLAVIAENTRAVVSLESSQRALLTFLQMRAASPTTGDGAPDPAKARSAA